MKLNKNENYLAFGNSIGESLGLDIMGKKINLSNSNWLKNIYSFSEEKIYGFSLKKARSIFEIKSEC